MTLQTTSWYRLLIGCAFFLSAAVFLPASAGEQPANRCPPAAASDHPVNRQSSTTVKFGDLDLNTEADRRALLDRLSKAAHSVCGREASLHSDNGYPHVGDLEACYRSTLAAAVDKVHHEQLSRLFVAMSSPNAP